MHNTFLWSVNCKMLLIKLSIYGREVMVIPLKITSYQSTELENMVKFYVPIWSFFTGPVTYATLLGLFLD